MAAENTAPESKTAASPLAEAVGGAIVSETNASMDNAMKAAMALPGKIKDAVVETGKEIVRGAAEEIKRESEIIKNLGGAISDAAKSMEAAIVGHGKDVHTSELQSPSSGGGKGVEAPAQGR